MATTSRHCCSLLLPPASISCSQRSLLLHQRLLHIPKERMFYRLPFCLPVGFSSQLAEGSMIVGGHSQLSGLTRAAVDSWELITSILCS